MGLCSKSEHPLLGLVDIGADYFDSPHASRGLTYRCFARVRCEAIERAILGGR